MTANLEQFTRQLDGLLGLRPAPVTAADPALQPATVLLALELEAESTPPADLRARWFFHTQLPASTERKSFMQTLRAKPALLLLVILLALTLLTGVAYALGKALGYIPGIGMVEQTSTLRSLDKPVSVERDGIRLTVLNVIASPTSTSVRFQVEWLTPPPTSGDYDSSCQGMPGLQLANGSSLSFVQTTDKFMVGDPGSGAGYGYVVEFAPVPADQNDVTFLYSCLVPLAPGPLPRDWKIPFHLISAPEGMVLTVVTVAATESTPVPATEAIPIPPEVDPTHRIGMSIDSYVPMDDGYLLIGSMQWSAKDYPAYGVSPMPFMGYVHVVDANGQEVAWEEAFGNVTPQNEEYRSYWAIKISHKDFAAPLTITLGAVDATIAPVPFRFDVGADPKPGQSWDINQDIQIAGSLVHFTKANLTVSEAGLDFQFDVQVDPNAIGDLHLNTPLSQCMGGGGGYPNEHVSLLQVYAPMCIQNLPLGQVDMQVTGAVLWGQWQATWQP